MIKLLQFINERQDNAYKDFKLVSVIFDESKKQCTFKFLYRYEIRDNDRRILTDLIDEYLGADVKIIVKCKKAYVDNDLVRDIIYNFVVQNYASIAVNLDKKSIKSKVTTDSISVLLRVNEFQHNYITTNNIINEIKKYAENFFFEEFSISLKIDNDNIDEDDFEIEIPQLFVEDNLDTIKYNPVTNVQPFVGSVNGSAILISSISGTMQNIEIAGKIAFFTEKSFQSKRKDDKGEFIVKNYYSFVLSDSSGRMNCVYFPTKADASRVNMLTDGLDIIVSGDVEEFNGRVNFKVKSIARCEFPKPEEESEDVQIMTEPNEHYIYIKPEKVEYMVQDNFFDQSNNVSQYLLDNDVVVFDVETTGLEASRSEIIEIGAVKIRKGKIIETFQTLVKPSGKIPDEIVAITNISDDMVKDALSIKQVLPDFYKFCHGSVIMAYNIDFDYKFISMFGKKIGLVFDHKQIDVMYLARSYIRGLKNFKLSTVCKKLNVSLENAHRAVNDAMATAHVVLKLSSHIA